MVRAGEEWHVTKGSCEVTVTSPKRGIKTQQEIDTLDALGMDAVVGMALYSGKIPR
jgi:phosphoribosylformimino-5-aminoimidazole carboxamide ribonucleotide (ProFAR) isomerase